ncbi:MAG: DUF1266 domain-containing protein [Lachnospiraceae bacterium]|nr:DUF1266 domain-containing protein [Lachnospiraceae bacterium]
MDIGKQIQENFASWDEYMESYFLGYEYWSEESSDERRTAYEELRETPDSPYSIRLEY